MHLRRPTRFLILFFSLAATMAARAAQPNVYDAHRSGAVGDGVTKDTAAIQTAIDTAAAAGQGTVYFPPGTYLTGSIELKSHVTLNLAAGAVLKGSPDAKDYPIIQARWEGIERKCHEALIYAHDAQDIAITGSGSVIGEGKVGHLRNPRGPALIEPIGCKDVRITGVKVGNTGVWTMHPTYCQNVTISNVIIDSSGGNSDGIDPDSSQHVTIDHCTFSSGDDDIAIKSGKGQEGVKIGMPTDDLTVTNCTFTKGHGGVALGSELSGGISNVKVSNCVFSGVKEALYIKSCPGRAGYVRNIQASQLTANGVPLLIIMTTYHSNPDSQGVPGDAGLTTFTNISVSDVTASSSKNLVKIEATEQRPVDGLTLTNIKGVSRDGLIILHAKNVVLKDITLDGLHGPLLYTQDVQGTGLDGAAPYVPKTTGTTGS